MLHVSSPTWCAETGLYITHSGWAALAAYKTAHWLQNPTVHSQRTEWLGPCLSGWPPYPASEHYIDRPWTSSKTYGDRVFMSVAPRPWNELPEDIWNSKSLEVFKTNLNTHLYLQSFYRRTRISPLWDFSNVNFWKFCFCVVFLLVRLTLVVCPTSIMASLISVAWNVL